MEKEEVIRIVENPTILNEIMQSEALESWESKNSPEQQIVNLENSKEILLRKREAVLQALDLFKSIICYGELSNEIYKLNDSLEGVDFELKEIETGLEQLRQKEVCEV